MFSRRSIIRRAGLGLFASLLPKALNALPRGKAGSGGGGSSPATIRITVSSTNYDLAIATKVSEGSYVQGTPYNINQLFYDIPVTSPLAAALPGIVVKWRPDNGNTRYEIIIEMSTAIGPNRAALPTYSVQLLDGSGATITMMDGMGNALPSSVLTVGTANPSPDPGDGYLEQTPGHILGQSVRMISSVRPIVKTASQLAATGATLTYVNSGSTINSGWSLTPYWPLSNNAINMTGQSGPRPDLAVQPEWTSQWLAVGDSASLNAIRLGAETVGAIGCTWRDSNGQIFNISNFPNYSQQSGGGYTQIATNTTPLSGNIGSLASPSVTHHGEFCYVAYLLTGDSWYLEKMQAWWTLFIIASQYALPGAGICNLVGGEERGTAWVLRDLTCCCLGTPASGLPSTLLPQSYFLSKLQNNYQYYLDGFVNGLNIAAQRFGLLWGGQPYNNEKGFGHTYRSQVINWMVWAGLPWQALIDFDSTWLINVGNGTSGWGYDQTGGSYAQYYHADWCSGDQVPALNWRAAWDLNASASYATFTGTISGGNTLTISGTITGAMPAWSGGSVLLTSGVPLPVNGHAAGVIITSGSGSVYSLVGNGVTVPTSLGPQAMKAQSGYHGPWYIDPTTNVVNVWWTDTSDETVSSYDSTQINLAASPPETLIGGSSDYQTKYAAVLRGAIALGWSSQLTPILANYNANQYTTGFQISYSFGSRTTPTIPTATTDSFYISPHMTLSPGQTYPTYGYPVQFTLASSSLLQLAGVNSSTQAQPVAVHTLNVGGFVVTGTTGQVQYSDGHIIDMATMTCSNATPAITVSTTFGGLTTPVTHGTVLSVTGTCFGPAALTSFTAQWIGYPSSLTVSATVSGVSITGGIWTASITAPAVAGTYALVVTGTGGNLATSNPSSIITVV